jgi:hypothetical protein
MRAFYFAISVKRQLRFAVVFAIALAVMPFLPLYIERTMVRSWTIRHNGDVIDSGWQITTLASYWSNYSYLRPEQQPALWLGVNLGLDLVYALLIALVADRLIARRHRIRK